MLFFNSFMFSYVIKVFLIQVQHHLLCTFLIEEKNKQVFYLFNLFECPEHGNIAVMYKLFIKIHIQSSAILAKFFSTNDTHLLIVFVVAICSTELVVFAIDIITVFIDSPVYLCHRIGNQIQILVSHADQPDA